MGWETRNGRQYYYEKVRQGDKVFSRYIGRGELVGPSESLADLKAEMNILERHARREQIEIDKRVDAVCAEIRDAVRSVLSAHGFHQHKGQWRKKRMTLVKKEMTALRKGFEDMPIDVQVLVMSTELWACERKGKEIQQHPYKQRLTQILQTQPELYRVLGDLVTNETKRLIEEGWRGDFGGQESVKLACQNLQGSLGYEQASPLERMAIEEVTIAWVRLYEVQERHTSAHHNREGVQVATGEFWDRRLMYSQRRYLRACESLARIRKLSKGIQFVQVNIATEGGQQVIAH